MKKNYIAPKTELVHMAQESLCTVSPGDDTHTFDIKGRGEYAPENTEEGVW